MYSSKHSHDSTSNCLMNIKYTTKNSFNAIPIMVSQGLFYGNYKTSLSLV